MDKRAALAALVPALMLQACDRPGSEAPRGAAPLASDVAVHSATPAPDASSTRTAPSDGDRASHGSPDLAPRALTPEAEKGVRGARKFLLSFARAIELKEFDQAWAMLSSADQQKWSKAAVAGRFAGLEKIAVAIAGGTSEGAAGSIYYEAPITITANDKDGRPVRYEGQAVLKRVNDVDGATPAQLRWHFDRLTLDWTH